VKVEHVSSVHTPVQYCIYKNGGRSFLYGSVFLTSDHSMKSEYNVNVEIFFATRGRILGRNPDKSFPPCYSQSPLQLCLEISITSNSCFLTVSRVQLLYTAKQRGIKPARN
jgi:hypothetical protein